MKKKLSRILYKFLSVFVKMAVPRYQTVGADKLSEEPVIIVANHSHMYGPIACEFYLPCDRYTWCAGQMMHLKEVPAYAFQDFWSYKPKYIQWFYKILSYLIAPIAVCIFNNAQTIGVYKDARIISTFKNTVNRLAEGASVVVFPEHYEPYNHILNDFQDKFIDIARLYYKKTGKALTFVPMYIAPKLKTMYLGDPVRFDPQAPMDEQRQKICSYLKESITDMAVKLPVHTVVPYVNVPAKEYPKNREVE